jgi:hypothetical protein
MLSKEFLMAKAGAMLRQEARLRQEVLDRAAGGEEELASVRYVELVGILLEAFEGRLFADLPGEEGAPWPVVLDRMRQGLAFVAAYVEGGRISAHMESHCSGTLDAFAWWYHQREGDRPHPFPFDDRQLPPEWGGARNELEGLRGALEIDRWQLGEEWYQEIRKHAGPAATRPFDVNMGQFLD